MDFRLRVFLSVAEHLSFTQASKALGISQPAITKHIQELENTFGIQLVSRQKGVVALTPAGDIFCKHATAIIGEYRKLQDSMEFLQWSIEGELKLGTDIPLQKIAPLLDDFTATFPKVRISITTGTTTNIKQALAGGGLHIAILGSGDTGFIYVRNEKEMDERVEKFSSFVHKWKLSNKCTNTDPCSAASQME